MKLPARLGGNLVDGCEGFAPDGPLDEEGQPAFLDGHPRVQASLDGGDGDLTPRNLDYIPEAGAGLDRDHHRGPGEHPLPAAGEPVDLGEGPMKGQGSIERVRFHDLVETYLLLQALLLTGEPFATLGEGHALGKDDLIALPDDLNILLLHFQFLGHLALSFSVFNAFLAHASLTG